VSDLKFEPKCDSIRGFRADAMVGHTVFEVLVDPRDLRQLRSSLMEIAKILSSDRRLRGILILDEPQIGDDRLREEWDGCTKLFRPEILDRITIVIRRDDTPDPIFGHLSDQEAPCIELVVDRVRQRAFRPKHRPAEAFFDILRVLLIHWFRKSGPLTSKELAAQAGFSYPTIAKALERLDAHLNRHSDRRVELQAFPRDAWLQLLAQAETVRSSQGFADRSGRPRSPEVLLDRLRELDRDDVAVGGVVGARHYLPGFDLTGAPRLDLVVHARKSPGRSSLLRRLDPALKAAKPGEPCQIVVHTLFRPESFFSERRDGLRWADEVECLLDLHEARLESQALEFFDHLVSGAEGSAKILVAEDQDQVGEMIRRALTQLGHKPSIARTGPTALRRFSDALSSSEPFDLVLLDVGIPGVFDEVFGVTEIHRLDPNARVIAVTGYALDVDSLIGEGFAGILLKPLQIADLERAIRDALSQPRSAARPNP